MTVAVLYNDTGQNFWTLASEDCRRMCEIVNHVTLMGCVCLFGITTNVINIIVFVRQGPNNTINISLLGIAISDLASLVTLSWLITCLNPFAERADVPFVPDEIQYLTGGWPHLCFTRTTCCITLYITAERCLCIAMPLKVKQILTPARTKFTIIFIFFLMILTLTPEYATVSFGWKYKLKSNKTLLGLIFIGDRDSVSGFVFLLHAILGISSFLTVTILTIILIIKLEQKSKWRQKSTFSNEKSDAITNRDKKTMTMVVLIAVILIICFFPTVTFQTIVFFEQEFSIVGKYSNIFHIMWSFAFLFEAINSSVNIFLYYNMSTKYRDTFKELFHCIPSTT